MFRDMLLSKQALSHDECIEILKQEPRGVLSVLGDDDYPYGLPIDYWYCEEDGKLYFHCGKTGHKIDAIQKHDKVSFCVCDSGCRREEGDWALTIRSVIVFGRVSIVNDYERAMDIIRQLSLKFTQDTQRIEKEIRSSGPNVLCFALTVEHMSGKTVLEA